MRLVIQRVSEASVTIDSQVVAKINQGLMVLIGIEEEDKEEDAAWLSKKLVQMRIFNDEHGLMNLSVKDVNGSILLVSQFTLHASAKKGNRPSFIRAAKPNIAIPLYEKLVHLIESDLGQKVPTGVFGADMKVALVNDGPVTIILDSKHDL